jgi:hypothetical protein
MRRRKPQPVCKCKHAKSQHGKYYAAKLGIDYTSACGFCWDKCLKFDQDNLRTLEKLSEFAEQKSTKNISL